MELNDAEIKAAVAIAQDMDLMNWARDYTGLKDTSTAPMDVLAQLHQDYPGGVLNFYNEKKF